MSVEEQKMISFRRNLTAIMFIWPAFDAIKILRYMQEECGFFFFLVEKNIIKYNQIAVNLHLVLFMLTFNFLQRIAET